MLPKVSLIILNWNNYKDTSECVRSLLRTIYENREIIIVDNGSADNSLSRLENEFSECTFIKNKYNLGFAGGNNEGIKYALKHNAEYIMLINDDVVVDENFLQPLVETMENDKQIGVVGPMMLFYRDKKKIQTIGDRINLWLAKFPPIVFDIEDKGQFRANIKADYITGAGLMIRSETVEKIGLMDYRYFLYVEEIDWCYRAKKAGYGIVGVPRSKIWHKVSASLGDENPIKLFYQNRNKIYFMKKHAKFYHWPSFIFYFTLKKLKDYQEYRKKKDHWQMIKKGVKSGIKMKKTLSHTREMKFPQDPLLDSKQIFKTVLHGNQISQDNEYWYRLGRIGLCDVLDQIWVDKTDEVLVPTLICDAITEVLDKLGIKYRFYSINDDLTVDTNDLVSKIGAKTKAVIVVNYFGFEQNYVKIREICNKHSLILIEDNSHGQGSKTEEKKLGEFGDISITSFYKSLPINDGAILRINNNEIASQFRCKSLSKEKLTKVELINILKIFLMHIKSTYGINVIDWIRKGKFRNAEQSVDSIDSYTSEVNGLSNFSIKFYNCANWEKIIKKRQNNYRFWLKQKDVFDKFDCEIVYKELGNTICPLGFPIRTDNSRFINLLLENGIGVIHWPGETNLPSKIKEIEGFQKVKKQVNELYILPIHQDIDTQKLKKRIKNLTYV